MELGTADAMIERRYFRSRSTNLWRRACPAAVGSLRPRWERIIEKFHWLSEMFADVGAPECRRYHDHRVYLCPFYSV